MFTITKIGLDYFNVLWDRQPIPQKVISDVHKKEIDFLVMFLNELLRES